MPAKHCGHYRWLDFEYLVLRMKTIEILEIADVQAVIDEAFAPWVAWSDQIVSRLEAVESVNKAQNKKINAQADRITALEERLASADLYTNVYTDY